MGRYGETRCSYIWLIPLLPGVGAAVNGLIGIRCVLAQDGRRASPARRWRPRWCCRSSRSGSCSALPAGRARATTSSSAQWIPAIPLATARRHRLFQVPWGFRLDPLSAMMLLVVTGIGTLIHVYSTAYMARRAARRRRAVLLLPEPVLLLHAHARAGQQLPGDVRGLGGRRALLVPADRLLVREEERG